MLRKGCETVFDIHIILLPFDYWPYFSVGKNEIGLLYTVGYFACMRFIVMSRGYMFDVLLHFVSCE